jgi:glycosyltransferase involved in cell wall biosynthesis
MKRKPVTVRILKTHYPQWGRHTAFNACLRHFDSRAFNISMKDVPMGDGKLIPASFSRFFLKRLRRKKIQEYGGNDFWAEGHMFGRALLQKIDVIHFIDAEHSLLFLPGWFRKLGFIKTFPKIVAMFHQPPAILEKIIDKEIAGLADRILTVAPDQADFFSRFVPVERISTIRLGVDTEHFKPLSAKKDPEKFRCLGGGVWLRDYRAFFETAKRLAGIPEIEFHIVAPALEIPASAKNIVFHRGISDAALLELYQNSHVLFLPLKDATANTFLLEGCACGLPIVSTDLPSTHVYFPGEEAILIKDNDPLAFAKALTDLYRDPHKQWWMSQCARERALQFSWKKIVREYERMYRNLVGA